MQHVKEIVIYSYYIKTKSRFGCICWNRSHCHEMLELWNNWSDWMKHDPKYEPNKWSSFGKKQNFVNIIVFGIQKVFERDRNDVGQLSADNITKHFVNL